MKSPLNHSRIATLFCFLALSLSAVFPQSAPQPLDQYDRWINGISEPWWFRSDQYSQDEAARARANWEIIGSEIRTSPNEWAGDYRSGDLHGAYLRLSGQQGFVLMSVFSCEANVTDVDYGQASVSSDLVQLFPQRPARLRSNKHSHSYHVPTMRYIPIKWDTHYFLVPEKEIANFADELAGLGRFNPSFSGANWIDYFSKLTNDFRRPATGLPVFPEAYKRLLKRPIDAAIVKIGPKSIIKERGSDGSIYFESRLPVTLDAGRVQGVKRGMIFQVLTSGRKESLEINYVGASLSTGVITRHLDGNMLETYTDYEGGEAKTEVRPAINLGQIVSTSTYR